MKRVVLMLCVIGLGGCTRGSSAGEHVDAGAAVLDASTPGDAAAPEHQDAAQPVDANVDAPDAHVVPDAATAPDAAVEPDAAVTADAGEPVDAAVELDAALPPDAAAPVEVTPLGHGARVVEHNLPSQLQTGEVVTARITLQNTGTVSWRAVQQYFLGSPMDEDPFEPRGRVELPVTPVEPGALVTFEFPLVAPAVPGLYRTDWRMLREHVEWFGETAVSDVTVTLGACSNPVPPPLDQMRAVIHNNLGWRKVLDSTPIVYGHDYCQEIGFTDDRLFCPPRPEGHPQVDVCNELVVGHAADTGRVGPTWTFNGLPCVDAAQDGRCVNHGENQFLVVVFGPGTARACARNNICQEVTVE